MHTVDSTATDRVLDSADEVPDVPRGRCVLVVDDHEMVRVGLRALLVSQPWVGRCLGAGSGERAIAVARQSRPHLALVDLFVAEESGIDLCRELRAVRPSMSVILMSGTGTVSPAVAHAAGACGFLPKHWPARAVLDAVRQADEGRRVFPRGERVKPATALSRREQDVLCLLVDGLSNVQIAEKLYLSRHTVKQHTRAIYSKLAVKNRAAAASRAQQLGLVRR